MRQIFAQLFLLPRTRVNDLKHLSSLNFSRNVNLYLHQIGLLLIKRLRCAPKIIPIVVCTEDKICMAPI